MTNHVHMVVQVGGTALSRIMQNLSFRYTRHVNSQQKRFGHLFQGRYKAILIDKDTYLLELVDIFIAIRSGQKFAKALLIISGAVTTHTLEQ